MLGGAGQQNLVSGGTNMLSSLLGGSSTSAITNAVGKFAGIDSNQSGSLLGMLAPVVMGQLAQTQKASGLDAGGLVNLLNGQKDNIAAAMPAGFSSLLQGTGVLDSIAGNLKQAAPVSHAAPSGSSGGMGKFLLPLVLGLAALYLLTSYGCNREAERAAAPEATPAVTTPAVPAAPAAADLTGIATKALSTLTSTLGTVTDEATAKAAIPALQDAGKQIDGLKLAAAALSGEARKPISTLVGGMLPGLTAAVEKAVGIPGVGAILNPVLQPVVANLEALSK
jgi:hypothetical protein